MGADAAAFPRSTRTRLVLVLFACAVAFLTGLPAPDDWPEGSARVTLRYQGDVVLRAAEHTGSDEPFDVSATAGDSTFTVWFPEGIPVDAPVRASVGAGDAGASERLSIEDVELDIELPDGRVELIPIIRWNEAEQRLEALRRPTQDAAIVLGLLGTVVVLWVTEAFPLFVTSLLIPVVLVVSGVADAVSATADFFNPIIILFFAGFLLAEVMRRTGLDHYVAVTITARAGHSPAMLYASMLALTAFLSMWMSNTAAAAVLIPIAIAITAPLGVPGYQRALVLGIAYASTIGGVGSAIGTPANQLAIEFLEAFGRRSISFVEWFAYGLPMVALLLPVIGFYLWKRAGVRIDPEQFTTTRRLAAEERRRLGSPTRDQLVVLAVFAAIAIGWLTQTFHGIHAGIVALAGAVLLFALGKLLPEDLGRISWPALLTFGGGLTLGVFLVESGTSDFIATRLAGLSGLSELVALLGVGSVTLVLTTVASNTASAAILIPLAIPLAGILGIQPVLLVIVVAIASSIDFALVIGTPPTMLAYATDLFTAGQILRTGFLLDVAGIVILVFGVTRIWELFGIV